METVFAEDPLEMALKWQSLGAMRLHIVDLDGAVGGSVANLEVIKKIASALLIPVQLGGGIRNMETVKQMLSAGVERVILGTVAVENPEFVRQACQNFQENIIVGIDARDMNVATHGWLQGTDLNALDFVRSMMKLGARRFIYTDISRDGTLTEPNFSAVSEMVDAVRSPIIAAGGVASLSHLKTLKKLGVEGAIVGKAIYTGDINLKQALETIDWD